MVGPLGDPLREVVDTRKSRCGDERKKIKFHGGWAGGEQGNSKSSTQNQQAWSGIFRSEKAQQEAEYDQKGKRSGSDFEPKVRGIRADGNKLLEEMQGGGGKWRKGSHTKLNSIGSAECQSSGKIQRVAGIRSEGTSGGFWPGSSRAEIPSR